MTTKSCSESNIPTRTQDVYRTTNGVYRVYAAVRQMIVFQLLRIWAWVELNYRPHAYQAPSYEPELSSEVPTRLPFTNILLSMSRI